MAIHPHLRTEFPLAQERNWDLRKSFPLQVTGSGQHLVLPPLAPMEQSGEI